MDQPLKFALTFFSRTYERILLIVLFIQVPLLAAYFFIANYIYAVTPTYGSLYSAADIYNAWFMIMFFLFAQVPFLYFWHYEESGHEKPLRYAFLQTMIQSFHFFVFAVAISLLVTIGFAAFVLPGLIILGLFISAPVIAIMDQKSVWKSVRESIRLFKRNHWKIMLLMIFFSITELAVSVFAQTMIISITESFMAIVLSHLVLNTIFLPLFYLTLAVLVAKWRQELGLFETGEELTTY
ncbi:hypothetical protein [Jeotgalibacillus haloalkalitolerans]|uniref:Uncharacterized protein n=1 Tax=Jeotgalibacillus haloalkalitolerans TaxID=3104292 RepID=A0ABU5KR07_9BACL|nr:hypothetical protein [Jeotgalibacillus sp. HH7-29]MDZ5713677.1 hypothetical protein [Jeotgalibacillus sp. HH7-29]